MKSKIWTRVKGFIGLLLLIAVGVGIFYWESYGRESLIYKEVVVLAESVERNKVIEVSDLATMKIDENSLAENVVLEPNSIIGKEAKHYIPKGVQLVSEYFGESSLVLDEGEFIFKIPTEWLKSFPSTLRRGDVAYIYPLETGETIEQFTVNKTSKEPVTSFVVAYVKDSANREVINTSNDENRLDSTSNVATVEVVATTDQLNKLINLRQKNFEFLLLYN